MLQLYISVVCTMLMFCPGSVGQDTSEAAQTIQERVDAGVEALKHRETALGGRQALYTLPSDLVIEAVCFEILSNAEVVDITVVRFAYDVLAHHNAANHERGLNQVLAGLDGSIARDHCIEALGRAEGPHAEVASERLSRVVAEFAAMPHEANDAAYANAERMASMALRGLARLRAMSPDAATAATDIVREGDRGAVVQKMAAIALVMEETEGAGVIGTLMEEEVANREKDALLLNAIAEYGHRMGDAGDEGRLAAHRRYLGRLAVGSDDALREEAVRYLVVVYGQKLFVVVGGGDVRVSDEVQEILDRAMERSKTPSTREFVAAVVTQIERLVGMQRSVASPSR